MSTKSNVRQSITLARFLFMGIAGILLALVLCEVGLQVTARVIAASTPIQTASQSAKPTIGDFNQEYQAISDSMSVRDDLRYIPDFRGTYFNITNNRRATTDQPLKAQHVLWVFGSSTVLGLQVPDALTMPSYLQRSLRDSFRVENMGVTSANTAQQLWLLERTDIRPDDLIIFYDGAQDEIAPYYVILNRRAQQPTLCQRMGTVGRLILMRALCSQADGIQPTPNLTAEIYQRYTRPIVQARAYALAHGARFYHFLQPTIFSMTPREDEKAQMQDFGPVMWASTAAFEQTPETVDLTHELDAMRGAGVAVYVDWVHLNARGNRAIAQAIYRSIFGPQKT